MVEEEQTQQHQEEQLQFPEDYFHFDKDNLLDQYARLGGDMKAAYELGEETDLFTLKEQPDAIYFIGMGGSSISGEFLKLYLKRLGVFIPVVIVRTYDLPPTVTEKSLVLTVSYSGNTEETLSAYRQAGRITKNIVGFASGGRLEEVAKMQRLPFVKVPKGFQPRTAALSYLFFPIIRVLERLKLIPSQKADVEHLVKDLIKPDFKKFAIAVSEKLVYAIPIIYASQEYFSVAYRFKTQINENAKRHAFAHSYSEFNHNELLGYTTLDAKYSIITFRFDDDHRRIHKRMDIVKEITNKAGVETTEIKLSGGHFLTKLFSGIVIGDLISYYLALRYRIDPSPVTLIENLKEKMGPVL